MPRWVVERIVHFEPGDFLVDGLAHFGFHLRDGRYVAISHPRHLAALVEDGEPQWTIAAAPVLGGVPNVEAPLEFPMFADALADGTLLVSCFESAQLYRVDPERRVASLLVDGHALGMRDMGNCVVGDDDLVWVNEVRGCRVWCFDADGRPLETIGDGVAGSSVEPTSLEAARFGWIYDLRRGPDGIYVLDSTQFALRVIDPEARTIRLVAGTGRPGYDGDGGDARRGTFGSDPSARFDGPISLALDDDGNAYVGDRFNHVVRMIDRERGVISTIAGRSGTRAERNDPVERDPLCVSLPAISSMDADAGRLLVPTDLAGDTGDLVVLRREG